MPQCICIFSVTPATKSVHIGVSDNEYTSVKESPWADMVPCLILKAPILLVSNLNRTCTTGIHGLYIYMSLTRTSTDIGNIGVYEVRVYMGKHCKTRIYKSFKELYTDIVSALLYLVIDQFYTNHSGLLHWYWRGHTIAWHIAAEYW